MIRFYNGNVSDVQSEGMVRISEDFWETIPSYFFENESGRILSVTDRNDTFLGYVYDDEQRYFAIRSCFEALEKRFRMPSSFHRIKTIEIVGLNEFAWRIYRLFLRNGYNVQVVGKEWDWFGVESTEAFSECTNGSAIRIYAEGEGTVWSNFHIFFEIARENEKQAYAEAITRLGKMGAAVCECCIPSVSALRVITEDEKKSAEQNLNIENYFSDRISDPEERETILRIYGRERIADLPQKQGKETKWISFGDWQGGALEGYCHEKRIYLLGPCIVEGFGCAECDSLAGWLQKYVDQYEYQVVSVVIANYQYDRWETEIRCLPVREQDIILIINETAWFSYSPPGIRRIELNAAYEGEDRNSMFCKRPIHTNSEGNHRLAEELLRQYLTDRMKKQSSKRRNGYLQKGEVLDKKGVCAVREYLERISVKDNKKAGAVVVNCNPFTKGHRYLIEYAASKVDRLYVFVVEEDKSFFKFQDRLEMVKKGTEDIANIVVAPSGNYIVSHKTMSVYFEKEKMQDVKIDVAYDVEIFARYIAPGLGIKKRFVGEEPFDTVTKQYNEQMKKTLPLFEIELEEIPRLQVNDETVSAAKIRACIRNGEWDMLKKMVPQTTYDVCLNYASAV